MSKLTDQGLGGGSSHKEEPGSFRVTGLLCAGLWFTIPLYAFVRLIHFCTLQKVNFLHAEKKKKINPTRMWEKRWNADGDRYLLQMNHISALKGWGRKELT